MSGAPWLRWSLALLMAAIACYHVIRLAESHRRRRYGEADVDLTHAAMGSAMTVMLVGTVTLSVTHFWALAFSAVAFWFVLRAILAYIRHGAQSVTHALAQIVLSGAMLFMVLAATGSSMTGMTMPGSPAAGAAVGRVPVLLFVAAVVAVGAWTALGLGRAGQGAEAGVAPRTTAGCQLAMSATTVYLLLLMV